MDSEYYGPVTAIGFLKDKLYYACNRIVKNESGHLISLPKDAGLIRKITQEFIISGDTLFDENGNVVKSVREYFPSLLPREHILDAKTINDKLYIITTHGYVFIVAEDITKMIRPAEAAVLYSARIFSLKDKVYFAYGTIFSGIQMYSEEDKALKKEFTLSGHKGSIFALDTYESFLASVSDDRTVCVWDLNTHKRIFSSTGHRARIWDVTWLDNNLLVTASEDSDLRVWDSCTGECLHILESHLGKHVWRVMANKGFVYSGGNDGSVRKWRVQQRNFEEVEWDLPPNDMKSFSISDDSKLNVSLSNGQILRCSKGGSIEESLYQDEIFLNYSIFEDHFVGSLDGSVLEIRSKTMYNLSENDKVCRIISSSNNILINYASGKIFIDASLMDISGTVTSFLSLEGDRKYIGFRDGRIVILKGDHSITLQKRNEAITGIIVWKEVVHFCDRSGHLMTLEGADVIGSDIKIHPGFLESLFIHKDVLLAAGFYQKNFFILDITKATTLAKVPCGGGHRQWQLKSSSSSDGKLIFAYLRLKKMHVVEIALDQKEQGECLTPAFHGREIRCGLVLNDVLITGDEEGTLILSSINSGLIPQTYLKGAHSNGIKSIKQIQLEEDLIVTVGSGEELKIWRVDGFSLKLLRTLDSEKDEVRFMDVEVWDGKLVVAGSDGSVRFYSIDSLQLLSKVKLPCCVNQLCILGEEMYAADSQGNVHNVTATCARKVHKNAILAMTVVNGEVLTGGDDCQIFAGSKRLETMHGSSVTGLCSINDDFASVGVDRRLVIWKNFESVSVKMTNVDDASALFFHPPTHALIIIGCGLELIKL